MRGGGLLSAECALVVGCVWCLLGLQQASDAKSVLTVELIRNWTLVNQNSSVTRHNLRIPSGVYSALYGEAALRSWNDVRLRWIAYDNWTYTKVFSLNLTDTKDVPFVNLTVHGLDTVAAVRLNHRWLGRTDNMFVRYSYDVSHILQEDNLLEIELKSPVHAARARASQLLQQNIIEPPECPPQRYHGECHMNMLRKMQASFAWDWGPAVPSMGIWKTISLEYYEAAVMRDIDVALSRNDSHWNMDIRVFIDANGRQDFYAELTFYAVELLAKPVVISDYTKQPISYKAPLIAFEVAVPVEDVTAWWPNGYGEQKLYPLHFTLKAWRNRTGPGLRDRTKSQKSIHIGFRTIELVEEPLGGGGNTFLFKVNGREVFAKGSNYIPSHILPELGADKARIKHLLQSAKESHLNMLRVWGGGIYESDYFYHMADHYGILIWQDMMFACAMYPATKDFLESVRPEVVQNAKRIGYHPSIAIVAANNENEVALAQNWYQTADEKERFQAEYRQLYLGTVLHELKILSSSGRARPLVSSPSNGKASEKDNYLSDDPQNPNYGDVHFYDTFKDGWNANIYPRPRFASEYGFQSLPAMSSWQRTLATNDSLLDLIDHRQHHPLGMLPITSLVRRHLPLPLPEDAHYAEALIYFSQIAQAMATKVETEVYRSLRDTEHRTMGALYWQLNDVWIAPSWSSIDFDGNYKLQYYWSKEFMAPIAIAALYDQPTKSINVSLICDAAEVNATGLEVTLNIYKWSDLFAHNSTTWPVTLKPNGVQYDKVIPLAEMIRDGFTNNNCFLEFVLQRSGTTMLAHTYYFPSSLAAAVGVRDPEIDLTISYKFCSSSSSLRMNSYSLTITVKYPAIFVYIELIHPDVTRYKLSRNGFMQVAPAQVIHLEFEAKRCIDLTRNHLKLLTVNQFMP